MNEIEELEEICNNGHQKLSGAAKFWVTLTILSIAIPIFLLCILVAVAFLK
jgi:hypothetical protein